MEIRSASPIEPGDRLRVPIGEKKSLERLSSVVTAEEMKVFTFYDVVDEICRLERKVDLAKISGDKRTVKVYRKMIEGLEYELLSHV